MRCDHQMRITLWLSIVVLASACAANDWRAQSAADGQSARVGSILHGDEPVKKVQPLLPPEAASLGIVGPVLLEIRIGESGDVSVLGVVRGHPLLDSIAKEAVIQWKYRPVVINGRTVPIIKVVAVSFLAPDKVDALLTYHWGGTQRPNMPLQPASGAGALK